MEKKILIVEDSKIIQERLVNWIKTIPGVVISNIVDNKSDAIAALEMETPDIAILDILLPDGTGIDILTKIKNENKKTTVIILTNYPYSLIKYRCLELGADYFLDKSIEFDEVFKVISKKKHIVVYVEKIAGATLIILGFLLFLNKFSTNSTNKKSISTRDVKMRHKIVILL